MEFPDNYFGSGLKYPAASAGLSPRGLWPISPSYPPSLVRWFVMGEVL